MSPLRYLTRYLIAASLVGIFATLMRLAADVSGFGLEAVVFGDGGNVIGAYLELCALKVYWSLMFGGVVWALPRLALQSLVASDELKIYVIQGSLGFAILNFAVFQQPLFLLQGAGEGALWGAAIWILDRRYAVRGRWA